MGRLSKFIKKNKDMVEAHSAQESVRSRLHKDLPQPRKLGRCELEFSIFAIRVETGSGEGAIKASFSESQIAMVLRQGEEGTSVEEICRKTGISQAG